MECPQCRWPTRVINVISWYHECIWCLDKNGEWYTFKPQPIVPDYFCDNIKKYNYV